MTLSLLPRRRGGSLGTTFGAARYLAGHANASGATATQDLDVSDFDLITILVSQAASASSDITVTIAAIAQDGTVFAGVLPVTSAAAALVGGNAVQAIQVNVTGLQGIEVQVKNNNAASKNINFVDVFAGVTGTDY